MEENIAGVTQTDAGSEKSLPCEREGDRVSGGGIAMTPAERNKLQTVGHFQSPRHYRGPSPL